MVYIKDIEEHLYKFAPKELMFEKDNVGALVCNSEQVKGVLCALDITKDVVEEALQKNCNLIVAHHPVIYRPLYNISESDVVYKLINNNIGAICMHTNADAAQGGVNDELAKIFNLTNVQIFGDGMGRIGCLKSPVAKQEFLTMCKSVFGNFYATVGAGKQENKIKNVALLGGSGADYMFEAYAMGADAFITGEAAHHFAIAANHSGKLLISAGHYQTEKPIVEVFANYIKNKYNQLPILISESEYAPFEFF